MFIALKRIVPALAFLLAFTACNRGGNRSQSAGKIPADTSATPASATPLKPVHAPIRLTDSMLAQLIRYYQNAYGNDSVHMSISRSDTLVELSFSDTSGGPDSYTGILLLAAISRGTGAQPFLHGDLDGDGLDDVLVSVHTEGGGGGGNVWSDDHFVFLADTSGAYRLATYQGDAELVGGAGYFFPDSIANHVLSGVSNEYAEDDGHCCPSLFYRLKLRLEHGKLTQVSKVEIARPKEFK